MHTSKLLLLVLFSVAADSKPGYRGHLARGAQFSVQRLSTNIDNITPMKYFLSMSL